MSSQVPLSTEQGAADLPDHVLAFGLVHVALRRDARRLVHAAPSLSPAVARWWDQVRTIIDWHHRSEDDVVWPTLRRQVPSFAALEQQMHGDHRELDRAMGEVTACLAMRREPDAATAVALRFESVLREHLRVEECVVLPIFARDLPVADYLQMERRVLASAPISVMSLLQPWMSDGVTDRTAARLAENIPLPVRVLGRTVLQRRYDRLVAPVLAVS